MPIAVGDVNREVNRDGRPDAIIVDPLAWRWPSRPIRLVEWSAREIGPGQILFGTDVALHLTGVQRPRIDRADGSARRSGRTGILRIGKREQWKSLLPFC